MEGFDADFDLGVEQLDNSPSNGLQVCFVLYANNTLWCQVIETKDLQPELLRWYLRMKKFDFVARDKFKVHTLGDLEQA